MKKAVLAAGGFLALAALWYVGPLSGQQTQPPVNNSQAAAPPAAPLRTRIAILNLTYVIKNYVKYQQFNDEIKRLIEPFHKKDTDLRQQLEKLSKDAAGVPRGQAGQGEEMEKQAREIKRQLEDNANEIKLRLGKRSDEEMKIVYQDVCLAVQSYARSHDFDLVLHYNDAVTEPDFLSPQNIARKMNTGALMPMHFQPNMDISLEVVKILNYNVSAAPPSGTPATQPNGQQH